MEFVARGLLPAISDNLERSQVVILEGARGVGKTSVARYLHGNGVLAGEYFTFADEATLAAAQSSPKAFVDELPFGSTVDEAQLVPEIQLQLKQLVDSDSRPGRALLTGSARLAKDQLGGSAPLAGRSVTLRLAPFTRSERFGSPTSILGALFAGEPARLEFVAENQADILAEAMGGGFPLLVTAQDRKNFIDDALPDAELGGRRRSSALETGRQLAARTAQPFVADQLANDLGIDVRTVGDYVDLWERVMLIRRLPNWRPRPGATSRAQKKLHVADIGLATAWGGLDTARDRGPLVETLVINELLAQGWAEPDLQAFHYREKSTYEVDLLLGRQGSDELVGIEVKAASEVGRRDFDQMKRFRERSKGKMGFGYVFYTGDTILPFGDDLWAVPIPVLWGPAPAGTNAEPLAAAIADMTARLRSRGNPSQHVTNIKPILTEAAEKLVHELTDPLNELGLRVARAEGHLDGIHRSNNQTTIAQSVIISGRSTVGRVAVTFEAAPSQGQAPTHRVTIYDQATPESEWTIIQGISPMGRAEAIFDVETLTSTMLGMMPSLTDALAKL